MDLASLLQQFTRQLKQAGIGTARLDVLILLEDVLSKDRAWLLAHPDTKILSKDFNKLQSLIARRAKHEPLAYVRGKVEFYGHEFVVNRHVLVPRPESETMIDILKAVVTKNYTTDKKVFMADIGSGSGALGITAALEVPNSRVELIEIDSEAIKVAKANVDLFTSGMIMHASDLLAGVDQAYDILLCNLPYVPDDFSINLAASHEPGLAIFGGPDGLNIYRRLFDHLQKRYQKPLYILCESLPPQHAELAKIAAESSYSLQKSTDFIQLFQYQN